MAELLILQVIVLMYQNALGDEMRGMVPLDELEMLSPFLARRGQGDGNFGVVGSSRGGGSFGGDRRLGTSLSVDRRLSSSLRIASVQDHLDLSTLAHSVMEIWGPLEEKMRGYDVEWGTNKGIC